MTVPTSAVPSSVLLLSRLFAEAASEYLRKRDVAHAGFECAARIGDARDAYWEEVFRDDPKTGYRALHDPMECASHWMQMALLHAVGYGNAPIESLLLQDGDRHRYRQALERLNELALGIIQQRFPPQR